MPEPLTMSWLLLHWNAVLGGAVLLGLAVFLLWIESSDPMGYDDA